MSKTRMSKTRMSKRRCLRMESLLHHDIVERILEKLPVNSLMRFKTVSKQWKSTMESRYFQYRVLKQSGGGDPHVLMVSVCTHHEPTSTEFSLRTLVLGSSSSLKIPTPWEKDNTEYVVSSSSCDGLVCIYYPHKSGFVVNPTTRWYRPLPLCEYQQLMIRLGESYFKLNHPLFKVGFGKDIHVGTYKPVWLYNSSEIGLENATTCELFDFSTNAWRYVTPASPYRVLGVGCPDPAFVDGSLHWFTDCQETKVVSFDLHTEAFQVVCKAPFVYTNPYEIVMCNLNNRLCVSEKKWPNQVIWYFNSDNKKWDKMFFIDLELIDFWHDVPLYCALKPLALLDGEKKSKKKKKLLFYDRELRYKLLTYDPETGLDDVAFSAESIGHPVCYFQSIVSIL
ncbi:PREDICTED: F-box/LRR-repeat/kelch-repeat protein At1g09650-like [Camelina sativa]|uniref:F-box/LRR-repeat/kelch-repeat protein At1g09650-like n=1 Tax=Camelina sativa TaxID=90675 RepID=A0ABM0UWB6_CAMSA|nr:PREDICTED: F-box/LRR-repeat/kelch-repeat protein At1g09650-like [Camelina sativa]